MLTTQSAYRKDKTTGISEMQHRHFATIATIIREELSRGHSFTHDEIVAAFTLRLRVSNPRFDARRFEQACGGVS